MSTAPKPGTEGSWQGGVALGEGCFQVPGSGWGFWQHHVAPDMLSGLGVAGPGVARVRVTEARPPGSSS